MKRRHLEKSTNQIATLLTECPIRLHFPIETESDDLRIWAHDSAHRKSLELSTPPSYSTLHIDAGNDDKKAADHRLGMESKLLRQT